MGNYVYSGNLLGLTIEEANQYVSENFVYMSRINWTQITKIRRTHNSDISNQNYNPTQLNVYTDDDGKITKISHLG